MSSPMDKAAIFESIINKIPKPVDIIVAIDSSGSVNDIQFEMMRSCVRQFINMFPFDEMSTSPPVRMGVTMFTNVSMVVCSVEKSAASVANAVTGMKRTSGGTSAGVALEDAHRMLKPFEDPNRQKLIVLLTDGDVSGAEVVANNLRAQKVIIICIGVGLAGNTSVEKIANSSLFLRDYAEMQNVFSNISTKPKNPPKAIIRSRAARNASFELVCLEQSSLFQLEVFEEQENQWRMVGETTGSTCYVKGINPSTVYPVRARAKIGGVFTNWSEPIKFRTLPENPLSPLLADPEKLEKAEQQLCQKLNNFILPDDLQDLGFHNINIVLLGRIRNGKSSYLNTVHSALRRNYQPLNLAKDDIKTVTLELGKFYLNNTKTIQLWDIYGWQEKNYQSEFDFIVDGNLRHGYKEGTPVNDNNFYNPSPEPADKAHAVIIVCEAPSVNTVGEMERLKEFFEKVTKRGMHPIVILTKPDTLPDADLEKQHHRIYDIGVIDQAVQTFCNQTKIDRNYVFPLVNYTGTFTTPNYVIQYLAMSVLEKALNEGIAKISRDFQNRIELKDKDGAHVTTVLCQPHDTLSSLRTAISNPKKNKPLIQGDFQFLNSSKSPIPANKEASTRINQISDNSGNVGVLYIDVIQEEKKPTKVGIVSASGEKLGAISNMNPNTPLSELRNQILQSIQSNISADFQFLSSSGTVTLSRESETKISDIADFNQNIATVKIQQKQTSTSEKIAIIDINKKKLGKVNSMPPNATLDAFRSAIGALQLSNFVFMDKDDFPVHQESSTKLSECIINEDSLPTVVIKLL